jgi:hypothetical protein
MDKFLVFPIHAVALNLQNPGFIQDDPMTLLVDIPVFRILVYLEFRFQYLEFWTMDKVLKPSNSEAECCFK